MKGRKPKPTALKLLEGNRGRRSLNALEPTPEPGVPAPLESLTPAALTHYRALSDRLSQSRVLTLDDGLALSVLAQASADYEQATAELARMGKVIETDRGWVKNPWTTIQKQAADQMQRGFAEFGLTPSSRSRVQKVPDSPEANPFANLA